MNPILVFSLCQIAGQEYKHRHSEVHKRPEADLPQIRRAGMNKDNGDDGQASQNLDLFVHKVILRQTLTNKCHRFFFFLGQQNVNVVVIYVVKNNVGT